MLPDRDKTKEQLVSELALLRQRVAELESVEAERRKAEIPLPSSEEYQRLFELSPVGITILDVRGVITACNSAVCMKSGYSKDDFIGKHFSKVSTIRARDIPKFIKMFASLIRGKVPKPLEVLYTRKDGTTGWTEAHISLMKLSGKRIGIQVIQNDITERKQAEEKLQESEQKYRSLFENMLNGFAYCKILVDKNNKPVDFVYLEINDDFERLTGLRREDVVGRKVTEAIPGIKEATPELFDIYGKVALTGEPTNFDIYFKPLSIWLTISVYSPQKGYFVAVFDNITERKQAEEALRDSGNEIRAIADNVPGLVLYVDSDGYYRFVNKRYEEWFSIQSEEVIGRHYWEVLGEAAYEQIKDYVDEVLTGHAVSFEGKILYALGGTRWVIARYIPDFSDDGKVKGFFALITDITERKRTEEALRGSEAKYRGLVTNVKLGIFRSTLEAGGRFLEVNPALEDITGYSRKELLQMSVSDLYVNPKERELLLEEVTSDKGEATKEVYLRKKDGTEIVVLDRKVAVRSDTGKILYFDGILEDITERKQVEEALYKSERQASAAIEAAKALTFNYDIATGKVEWSGAIEEITGYTKEEFAKVDIEGWAERIHPDDRDEILSILQEAMGKDRATAEYRFKTKKGYIILSSLSLTEKRDGKAVRLVGILLDITERKQAEQREKELQQELSVSRRLAAVGELAAGVAHEINNPLTGVLGFSERLLRKSTDEEIRLDLERIHNEAQRIVKVMDNLRTFTRRREPEKQYSDINDILRMALELRAYELRTGNIEVVTDFTRSLSEIEVDFQQIQEVFLNIILNAEQIMTEAHGGGKLTIKTEKINNHVRISFADDGPGISAEHLNRLFDPFFTTRGDEGGTGLGLSVCHRIVTEHGGRLYAKSKPGKGATFFVELPCS